MPETYIWFALIAGVLATIIIRLSGVGIAKTTLFARIEEETLSRVFPLVILFILVFKEIATEYSADQRNGCIKILGVLVVALLHYARRNLFLSVIGGTLIYLLLLKLFL